LIVMEFPGVPPSTTAKAKRISSEAIVIKAKNLCFSM
jgi:hypothetical protein